MFLCSGAARRRRRPASPTPISPLIVDAESGRPDASLTAIERSITAAPGNAYAQLFRAELLHKASRPAEALSAAQQAASIDPENEDIWELIGLILSGDGVLEDAETSYRRAIEIAPHRPLFHAGLGTVLMRQNRPAEALAAFRAAIGLNPDRANSFAQLTALMTRQDKFDTNALQAGNDNQVRDVEHAAVLAALAGTVERAFRLPDAAAALSHALTLAPDDEALHCGLAMLTAKPGDVRVAVADAT